MLWRSHLSSIQCLHRYEYPQLTHPVSRKTFGKASVQSVIPLDEKSAMKLTTARYYSPKGRMIDGEGIIPDIVVERGTEDNPNEQLQIKAAIKILQKYY